MIRCKKTQQLVCPPNRSAVFEATNKGPFFRSNSLNVLGDIQKEEKSVRECLEHQSCCSLLSFSSLPQLLDVIAKVYNYKEPLFPLDEYTGSIDTHAYTYANRNLRTSKHMQVIYSQEKVKLKVMSVLFL